MISILERKRRLTQWDIKPPGYENVTAEQAKLSGMFPLPGAPRQQAMDPSRLQAFMNQPGGGGASAASLKPSNARQSKRVFVSNLPAGTTAEQVVDFFNLQMNGLNVVTAPDPCVSGLISKNGANVMLEFRSPEDTTVALALDGITMSDDDAMDATNGTSNGASKGLSISRPKDYIAPMPAETETPGDGSVLSNVPDSPNKILVSSIPTYLNDEQVTELLNSFGTLKAFVYARDASTEQARVGIVMSPSL